MKEIEKFRRTNLTRIAYSSLFLGVLYYQKLEFLYPAGGLHLLFSLVWMFLIEREILVESEQWWSSFVPSTLDSLYLTLLVYVTGGVFSFVVIGYFITTILGSLTIDRNYGLYTAVLNSSSYAVVSLCTLSGLLPAVNIFEDDPRPPSIYAVLFAVPLAATALLLVNRIVSNLFLQFNAELKERKRSQERLERDLVMARRVQQSILPREGGFPKRAELSFGSKYLSLESVGGDLYDVYDLGENTYGFLMADVSGHGVPAALVTTMAKVAFGSRSAYGLSPDHVTRMVNADIYPLIGDLSYYLTAVYGVIDLKAGTLEITRAGHPPPLLLRRGGEVLELDTDKTMYIGVLEDLELDTNKVDLCDGDRLILFTDGLTEAAGPDDYYGDDRFQASIKRHAGLGVADFVTALVSDVDRYCAGAPPGDDRALLCVDFHIAAGRP